MRRRRCRSPGGGTSKASSLRARLGCVGRRRGCFWIASFCAFAPRRGRSPRRVRKWCRRCRLSQRKTSRHAWVPPQVLYSPVRRNKIDEVTALGTEHSRKEIQLALQSITVAVPYLSVVGGNSIEQCLQPPRQPPELLSAVGLDPLSIRMVQAALAGQFSAKVRVETHTRSHRRNRLT